MTSVAVPVDHRAGPATGEVRRLVLVGGGPASATVLMRLAERMGPPGVDAGAIEVTLVDRDGEAGGGDPHGARTAPALLLNDKLAEIDSSGIGFTAWLHRNRSGWIGRLLDAADPPVDRWLRRNQDALARTDFGGLYLPRCVFGDFIRERFAQARRDLETAGVRVDLVRGEVSAIRPATGGWSVTVTGASTPLPAHAVLLAVGSLNGRPPAVHGHRRYFSYARARRSEAVRDDLRELMAGRPPGRRRVVVLGSSAAATEVLYRIEGHASGPTLPSEVVVVSTSGRLPAGVSSGLLAPYGCEHLVALRRAVRRSPDRATSAAMVAATERDIADGHERGYTIVDILPALSEAFSAVFATLPPAEKRLFVEDHYVVYRELVRHTAPEYAEAVTRLTRRGVLTRVRARVTGIRESGDDLEVLIERPDRVSAVTAAAVFDCQGFTGVPETDNPVVSDVVRSGVARPNRCGRGLEVDDRFQAAPGLFVLGPVLGGTSQGGNHIWSLENIPRINALSTGVAADIWSRLVASVEVSTQRGPLA